MGICENGREEGWTAWQTLLLALVALIVMLLGQPREAAAADAVATGTRVGGDDTRTRFVADLTKPVSYSVYVLPNPYRVMIDLPDVTFDLPPGIGHKTRGLITEYRYGLIDRGRARIVIDTKGPVLIEKSFIVDPQSGQPARIVVDLVKTSEEAFLKTYKSDEKTSGTAIAEAQEQPAPAPPQPLPEKPGRRVVVIDPGHGGIDPGAIGLSRTREKDVVLAMGLALRDALKKNNAYDVVMTRSTDSFVSLKDRVKIARDVNADLFIAIHADTVRGPQARGATIYTLSEKASDAEAEALAQKENRSDIIAGVDLGAESEEVSGILIDLAQRESKNHSIVFARKAVAEMQQVTGFTGKPMRSAGFVVLKAPDVPSVLVELGYLSSKSDEARLASDAWRDKIAGALAKAVDNYFSTEIALRAN